MQIRAREIVNADINEVAVLLAKGLGYPLQYFREVLVGLARRRTPANFPKLGYLLESSGKIVGAILLIFTQTQSRSAVATRCHITSWYVEPEYRCFAPLFYSKALKYEGVTYLNISARLTAQPIIKAQGFLKYSEGQFATIPLLQLRTDSKNKVKILRGDCVPTAPHESFERDLLLTHADGGCICLWCITPERAYPFVFHRRLLKGFIPGVQLVYCSAIDDFVRFVRPIGLFLALQGAFVIMLDSNGPVSGLTGRYYEGKDPRYYKGPKPRLGDLSYTQFALFRHPSSSIWSRIRYMVGGTSIPLN